MSRTFVIVVILTGVVVISAGCGGWNRPDTLRIGLLPILDTLPMVVAADRNIFAEHGVAVEFVTVASAAERDQLLQTGQIDGTITDLVALALYNREAHRVSAVRYAMTPTRDFAQFRVMAARQSGITTPTELAGVAIGISEGTVIEYVTDRMLEAEGLTRSEIETLAVPKIPERMALLRSGELAAATLPEPLASLAMEDGAVVIVDDTEHLKTSCSVYAFREKTLDANPDAVHAFLRAVSEATRLINRDKDRWRDLLAEENIVPKSLMGSYRLPDYPGDETPSEAQFKDAVDWLRETGRLSNETGQIEGIDGSFLP
jgi:NitT/TauT family transport system substrate-binding protein